MGGLLAIDFGTANTVAMHRTAGGRTYPLLFDGSPLLPSAVCRTPTGLVAVGRDAEQAARLDPSRYVATPKRHIDAATLLGLPVATVITYVLDRVAAESRRMLGAAPEALRMTHPASWGPSRQAVLAKAAWLAGLPSPVFIAGPVAAATWYQAVRGLTVPVGGRLAVYHLGAGTFEGAVLRRTGTGFDILTRRTLPVGGIEFDRAIVAYLDRLYLPDHTQPTCRPATPAGGSTS